MKPPKLTETEKSTILDGRKPVSITGPESLDICVSRFVRLGSDRTAVKAELDTAVTFLTESYQPRLTEIENEIIALESAIFDYSLAHRTEVFPDKKSREIDRASFGFEFTPYRVEKGAKKMTWDDVVTRLKRMPWGKAYLKTADPTPDKNALLKDREKFTPEQLTAAGIKFERDEQFFIRPKAETAPDSTRETA